MRTLIQCRRNLSTSRWATPPPSASAPSLAAGIPIVVQLREPGVPVAIANIPDLALAPAVAQVVPRSIYERRIGLFNDVWAERMLAPAVALLR